MKVINIFFVITLFFATSLKAQQKNIFTANDVANDSSLAKFYLYSSCEFFEKTNVGLKKSAILIRDCEKYGDLIYSIESIGDTNIIKTSLIKAHGRFCYVQKTYFFVSEICVKSSVSYYIPLTHNNFLYDKTETVILNRKTK